MYKDRQGFFNDLLRTTDIYRTLLMLTESFGPCPSFWMLADPLSPADPFRCLQILSVTYRSFWPLADPFTCLQIYSYWILSNACGAFHMLALISGFLQSLLAACRAFQMFARILDACRSLQSLSDPWKSLLIFIYPFRSFQILLDSSKALYNLADTC